jgi:hypothetical protein
MYILYFLWNILLWNIYFTDIINYYQRKIIFLFINVRIIFSYIINVKVFIFVEKL